MDVLAKSEPSTMDDSPPKYSPPLKNNTHLSLDKLTLDGGEEFEKTSTGRARDIYSKCTRCSAHIETTTTHYGCTKCIEKYACICQSCHDTRPNCRIHHIPLIKRTLKPWHALPPWIDFIDPTPSKDDNPLIHAIKSHDDNLTTFHAQDPSLINAHTYLGYTPLHFAAHLGLLSTAKILLENGALTNSRDINNQTPLLIAIGLNHKDLITLLLAHGSNIHSTCGHRSSTALHVAAANGFPDLITLLLQQGAIIDTPSGRGTALQLACQIGSLECASILLEKGANPNARSTEIQLGEPPIVSAVRCQNDGLLEVLMKYGADVDLTRVWKDEELTALYVAISLSSEPIACKLIGYGANVNWRGKKEITYLMRASALGKCEMIKLLVEGGAELDAENDIGMNAVLFAAVIGKEKALETLLELGASGRPPKVCAGKWKRLKKFWKDDRVGNEARERILSRLREAKHR